MFLRLHYITILLCSPFLFQTLDLSTRLTFELTEVHENDDSPLFVISTTAQPVVNTENGIVRVSPLAFKHENDKENRDQDFENEKTSFFSKHDPLPLQVWKRYTREHAVARLNERSKFAIVPYWCPERAGNILHNVVNNVVWAIVHNRTILWQYSSDNPYSDDANAEHTCESILPRNRLFLTWSQAKARWNLTEEPIVLDTRHEDNFAFNQKPQVVYFPQLFDMNIVNISSNAADELLEWSHHPFHYKYQAYNRKNSLVGTMVNKMYQLGRSYTHGMLLRHLFSWDGILLNKYDNVANLKGDPASSSKPVSIALHSRHIVFADDGQWINHEKECLKNILDTHDSHGSHHNNSRVSPACIVYLMSDRPRTTDLLSIWLTEERGCQVVTFDHSSNKKSKRTRIVEHGPNSGIGFLQDLHMASHARTGLVGNKERSSYMLLEALVTYERVTELVANNRALGPSFRGIQISPEFCSLPKTPPTGYNYGPGTPTFATQKYLPSLAPDDVVTKYLRHHAHPLWQEDENLGERNFTVVEYSCKDAVGNLSHVVGNAWIFSIATNRTLLYRHIKDEGVNSSCDNFDIRSPWFGDYEKYKHRIAAEPVLLHFKDQNHDTHDGDGVRNLYMKLHLSKQQIVEFPRINMNLQKEASEFSFTNNTSDIQQLFSLGRDFLYGMLWAKMFHRFEHRVLSTENDKYVRRRYITRRPPNLGTNATVIFIPDGGSPIPYLESCISTLFSKDNGSSCEIVPATPSLQIEKKLSAWLENNYPDCHLVSANAFESLGNTSGNTRKNLIWLRHAAFGRHAVRMVEGIPNNLVQSNTTGAIGISSTADTTNFIWLRELLEYTRFNQTWRAGRTPPVFTPLPRCQATGPNRSLLTS